MTTTPTATADAVRRRPGHPRMSAATALRVGRSLTADPRTLGLVFIAPIVLIWLMHEVFAGRGDLADRVAAQMLAVFPLFLMFLLTAVSMVRERTSGTLERLLSTPLGKADLLLGYGAAFGALALLQASALSAFALGVLGIGIAGPVWALLLVSAATAILGVSLGLLASSLARNEFEAVQFFPVLVVPQILLCGLFGPREQLATWMQHLADWLPLTHAVDALRVVITENDVTAAYWQGLGVVAAVSLGLLVLASFTLRRRTP